MHEIFTNLKDRAALEHPTFPLDLWMFRVAPRSPAACLQCRMIHGTLWVFRETSLTAYLLENDNPCLAAKTPGIWHYLLAKWNETVGWIEMRRVQQYRTQVKKGFKDLYSTPEELNLIMVWWITRGIRSWRCILENSRTLWSFSVGKSTSRLKYAPVHSFLA